MNVECGKSQTMNLWLKLSYCKYPIFNQTYKLQYCVL